MNKKITIGWILGVLIFSIGMSQSLTAQVLDQDSLALVALYDSTDGANWSNNTNWLSGDVGTWYGIYVSNNRVTNIALEQNNLVGSIPPEIGNLTNLKFCKGYGNQLSGSIPPEIGNLVQLISLNLGSNQLSGAIPAEIGMLVNLESLELGENQLIGMIPAEIGNLTRMTSLSLNFNQLSGTIPPEIGNLSSLIHLYLSANQLTDPMPAEIFNLTNLKKLILSGNQFSGSIPVEIDRLTNLTHLLIQGNQFTGPIPPEIGNLKQLEWLYLNNNQLAGAVPEKIGVLPSLQWLYLYNNQLTDLPDLSADTSLLYLRIENNKFTFEDIEPNIFVSSFSYNPQDSVGEKQDTTIEQGASLTLSVTVGGTANQYQWMKDDVDIPGANSNSYIIETAESADTGSYICKITNTIATALTLYSRPIHVTVAGGVGIAESQEQAPKQFAIFQNYPNPFNPATTINYQLAKSSQVKLSIYNTNGQLVRTLVEEYQSAGNKSVIWNGLNDGGQKVASGVYVYRITTGELTSSKKMILMQ